MGTLAPWHWFIIIGVALLLFGGYRKLPEAARSLGRSMRVFKSEVSGLREDDEARRAAKPATPATPPVIEGEPIIRPTSRAEEPSRQRED
jgi:sec-independent protein translocase protein TatA